MKTLATLLCGGGVLVAGLAITPSAAERPTRAVVTLGPLEVPLPTPRVRVSNGHPDSVDVWYVRDGEAKSAKRLGWVSESATRTFQLPEGVGPIQIAVAPQASGEPFVTGAIDVNLETTSGWRLRPPSNSRAPRSGR